MPFGIDQFPEVTGSSCTGEYMARAGKGAIMPELRIESEIIEMVLGQVPEPPIDLDQIARRIGVRDVRRTMMVDGYTDFRHSRPVIYLSSAFTRARVRFVFAHELAHVMIRRPDTQELMCARGKGFQMQNEERLANSIAATLLIPDSWVDAFRNSDVTFARIVDASAIAEVSLAMIVTRLAAANINIALLRWQRGESSWHLVDRPGTPHSMHNTIELTESSVKKLDESVADDLTIVLEGLIDNVRLRIRGTVRRNGKYAAQLVRPSFDLWFESPARSNSSGLSGRRGHLGPSGRYAHALASAPGP
jgi:Zn-dependent peptidase ImmA (M78 family)